jgi:hypothetical protein
MTVRADYRWIGRCGKNWEKSQRNPRLGGRPMTKRLHTVEIEGYGPIEIRSLTKRQMVRCKELSGGNEQLQIVHIIRRGMANPKCSDEFLAEIKDTPNVLDAIGAAIIERSWPNVEP